MPDEIIKSEVRQSDDRVCLERGLNPRTRALYDACFRQDLAWNKWFFDNVVSDEDVFGRIADGNLVSMMLAQRYTFRMCGEDLPLAYISGVCTERNHRDKGHVHALMGDVLNSLHADGYAFAGLIPADDRLFFFYDRFGFVTTVYVDTMRYVDGHVFDAGEYDEVAPDYQTFVMLEKMRGYTVIHTERQYSELRRDAEMDGGMIFSAAMGDSCAVAVAMPSADGSAIVVKELLTTDDRATDAVLYYVTRRFGRLPMSVYARPGMRVAPLNARGMMRIIDVGRVLAAIAPVCKHEQIIRVHDNYITANNGVYVLHDGRCDYVDSTIRRLTLDVDISTLAEILFSTPGVGDIFGLPTDRAMLPLMLD